jgi:hydrogenase expression/formation protein HypE
MNHQSSSLVLLAHGDGGLLTRGLVDNLFRKHFTGDTLKQLMDAAVLPSPGGRAALTTDSYVISPIFFPGGDIGRLAVCGTVNDLAVSGARPQYLAASFIIEEGLELASLERIAHSMAGACREAGVEIVAGDTKVVERGHLDKIFITTTGLGWLPEETDLGYHRVCPGDAVLVNGSLGDHGAVIIAERYGLGLDRQIVSDCCPLNMIIRGLLDRGPGVKLMRDLTRGGLATVAKEIALSAEVDIRLDESALPVAPAVRGTAATLGIDPLYLANEGKFLAVIDPREVERALEYLRGRPEGKAAAKVGEVRPGKGSVYISTVLGGARALDLLAGAPLPRIC